MTSDPFLDEAGSTSQAPPRTLDHDKIKRIATMSTEEMSKSWHLICTTIPLSTIQQVCDSPVNKQRSSGDQKDSTRMAATQTSSSTDHISNNDASIQLTDPISTTVTESAIPPTTTASPLSAATSKLLSESQPIPTRVLRQRQPIQLQPFTEDLKQYHLLMGRKERFGIREDRSTVNLRMRTPSPTPQSFEEYDPIYADHIPSNAEDYEYDDSDGFVDYSDASGWGNAGLSSPPSIGDLSLGNNNDQGMVDTENDNVGQVKRQKRRIVLTDEDDDGFEADDNNLHNTTLGGHGSSIRTDNSKRNDFDIFDFPLNDDLHIPPKRNPTPKNLITYGRKRETRIRQHKTNNGQKLDISNRTSRSSRAHSPSPLQAYDIFDVESIDKESRQQIQTDMDYQLDDHGNPLAEGDGFDGDISMSSPSPLRAYDIFDIESIDKESRQQIQMDMDYQLDDHGNPLAEGDGFDSENSGEATKDSSPILSTTRQSTATSSLSTDHSSIHKTPHADDDDNGFIVDDDDYTRGRRRRNATLHEVRRNKRRLKGILPTSFTMVYGKQLDEEEKYKRPRTLTTTAKRTSSQETDRHDDGPSDVCDTTLVGANHTASDFFEIEETLWDDNSTAASSHSGDLQQPAPSDSCAPYHSENANVTLDSRRNDEEQRFRLTESIPVDCGIPFLQHGATTVPKLDYMDNEQFTLFSLHQDTPFPTVIFDQPFTESDYYAHSPSITHLFDLAYELFHTIWVSFENNDIGETGKNTTSGLHEKDMASLLGFLRFVSICIPKGYLNNKTGLDSSDDSNDGSDKVDSASEIQQFLLDEMNNLVGRILDLLSWTDGGVEMGWLKSCEINQGFSSPLLLVLVYFVEWSYQMDKVLLANPLIINNTSTPSHWTMKTSLRRLLWYLLTLGPSSLSVAPISNLLFGVSEPLVMEAWVVVLQLIKLENMNDSILWPSLQDFLEISEKPSCPENKDDDMVVWNKVDLTWKWVLTLASIQQIQKTDFGYGKVQATEFNVNTGCWGAIRYLLRDILQHKATLRKLSMVDKIPLRQFRLLTLIRMTFCRCHILLTKYNWMWDSKMLQYLYSLAHVPQLQMYTGHPIYPLQYHQQQDKVTAAKYFPHYFTNYDGTIPDDEISPTDTCGIVFLKILSYGIQKRVDMILETSSSNYNNDSGNNVENGGECADIGAYNNEHRENLQVCLARVTPAYLVAGDVAASGKPNSFLLKHLVFNPTSSLQQNQQINPLASYSYDYSINMAIIHATARLGSNNIGLDVLHSKFDFHSRLETDKACASEIVMEAKRVYENIIKKWSLLG